MELASDVPSEDIAGMLADLVHPYFLGIPSVPAVDPWAPVQKQQSSFLDTQLEVVVGTEVVALVEACHCALHCKAASFECSIGCTYSQDTVDSWLCPEDPLVKDVRGVGGDEIFFHGCVHGAIIRNWFYEVDDKIDCEELDLNEGLPLIHNLIPFLNLLMKIP